MLRNDLITLYRLDRRFQASIAQDLVPLWKRAGSPETWLHSPFRSSAEPVSETEKKYAAQVIRLVREMHLCERPQRPDGPGKDEEIRPADWAAWEVHESVRCWPKQPGSIVLSDQRLEKATITINATLDCFEVSLTATTDRGERIERQRLTTSAEAKRVVHNVVNSWLHEVDIRIRRDQKHYEHFNQGTIEERRREVGDLFRYLYHKEKPEDGAHDKRLRRLAGRMGIALPLNRT